MKREWMKLSPFTNKEAMREKILQEAMCKVKSERTKNIQKLRMGEQNFNGLARKILNDTMSVATNISGSTLESTPPHGCGEESDDMNRENDENGTSSGHKLSKAEDMMVLDEMAAASLDLLSSLDSDEAALIQFLGTEDHQLLMDQISEAIKSEYGDFEASDISLAEDVWCDWGREEEEATTDRYIICPVCRSSSMEIDDAAGRCCCGALLNLRSTVTGRTLTADQLRDILAAVYDRHLLVCDAVVLEEDSCAILSSGKTAGLYDDELWGDGKRRGDMAVNVLRPPSIQSSSRSRPPLSPQRAGELDFIQRDHSDLVALCSLCGFAERVL